MILHYADRLFDLIIIGFPRYWRKGSAGDRAGPHHYFNAQFQL